MRGFCFLSSSPRPQFQKQLQPSCNISMWWRCLFSASPHTRGPSLLASWSPGTLTDTCPQPGAGGAIATPSRLSLHRDLFTFPVAPHVFRAPASLSPVTTLCHKERPVFSSSAPPPLFSLSLSDSVCLPACLSPPLSVCLSVSPSQSLSVSVSLSSSASPALSVCLLPSLSLTAQSA